MNRKFENALVESIYELDLVESYGPEHSDHSPVNCRALDILCALRGYLTEDGTTNEQDALLKSIGCHSETLGHKVVALSPNEQMALSVLTAEAGTVLRDNMTNDVVDEVLAKSVLLVAKVMRRAHGIMSPIEALNHPDARSGPAPIDHSMDDGTDHLSHVDPAVPVCADCGCRH